MQRTTSRSQLAGVCAGMLMALGAASSLGAQSSEFALIDSVAVHAPADADMAELVRHLVGPARTERAKVRAIFRWVTHNVEYDTESFFSGKTVEPAGVDPFLTRKAMCTGYSGLFERMARLAGLEVVSIRGYAKGYGYKAGHRFDETNHAWNAVKIDGKWFLLDSTWGAGPVDGTRFVREFEDFWFLTPPEQMIFSHFPKDGKWQLLRKRMSKRNWEKQVYVRHPFFKVGFSPDSLLARSRDKAFRGVVKAFGVPGHTISVEQAPLSASLPAGSEHQFRIDAPGAVAVVAVNGGKWHTLGANDSLHSGTVQVTPGELILQARYSEQDPFSVFLVYHVAP